MAFANFIPEIWSGMLLAHLDKMHVFASLVNRDYEGDIRAYGDTVHINQISDITISEYTGANLDDPEELDSDQQTLLIDQARSFNFQIKDIDNAQSNPKLMSAAMERASYGINDAIDQYLAGLLIDGAGSTVDCSGLDASTAYEALVDMGTKLTEANVPMLGRWAVVTPAFYGYLLKDDRFVGNGTDYNRAVLENGEVGAAAGFAIHVSNNCTVPAVAGVNLAATFAEQLVEMEPYRVEKNFSDAVKGLHVFGAKVLQPQGLAVLSDGDEPNKTSVKTTSAKASSAKASA